MDRIKTGVNGLDNLIEGGIPKGSFIVFSGGPGSGKSILASQFIAKGILDNHEKGLYISIEQSREEIVEQARQFGWDFKSMEDEGNLKIVALNSQELYELQKVDDIKGLIQQSHFDRVVIDSITSLIYAPISSMSLIDGARGGIPSNTFNEMCRSNATMIIDTLKHMGITTVGVAQKIEGMPGNTTDNISEFKGDGLFILNSDTIGKTLKRTIQIKKLRKTKIDGVPYTFDFTKDGISLTS